MSRASSIIAWAVICAAWFVGVVPLATESIMRAHMEGPQSISVENVEVAWDLLESTNPDVLPSAVVTQEIQTIQAKLRSIEQAEDGLAAAIWQQLDASLQDEGRRIAVHPGQLPFAIDPRFVEPEVPSLVQALVDGYGIRQVDLAPIPPQDRAHEADRRKQLQAVYALVITRRVPTEGAAQILDGALSLLDLQLRRRDLEAALVRRLPPRLADAARMAEARGPGNPPPP